MKKWSIYYTISTPVMHREVVLADTFQQAIDKFLAHTPCARVIDCEPVGFCR